jgi:hypothetical protein
MKQLIVKCALIVMLAFGFSQAAVAQHVYVRVQPRASITVRPAAPRPNYIWVDGEWVRSGRGYVYRQGYWVAPRASRVWIPGHWIRARRGWFWAPGYWRRM